MKRLPSRFNLPSLYAITRVRCNARTAGAARLHSHSNFMEASSNVVNIYEINSIPVYDLKSYYKRIKAKAHGMYSDTICTVLTVLNIASEGKNPFSPYSKTGRV